MTTSKAEPIFWVLCLVAILLSGLSAFVELSEFVTVGILKQVSDYPFGSEGPVPWYYRSAQLYAVVTLLFGVLHLLTSAFGAWALLKARKRVLVIWISFFLLLVILQTLISQENS